MKLYGKNNKVYMTSDHKILGNSKGLPSDYQELEFIESVDTKCCINTNYIPSLDVEFEIKFAVTEGVSSNIYILGTAATTSSPRLNIRHNSGSTGNFTFFTQGTSGSAVTIGSWGSELGEICDVVVKANYTTKKVILEVNGIQKADKSYSPNKTYDSPIRFFNYSSDTSSGEKGLRIYYFKLVDNGGIVREMKPCYRISDNEIGMFDLINGIFYPNVNTGELTYSVIIK